jgi:hypothetical protein
MSLSEIVPVVYSMRQLDYRIGLRDRVLLSIVDWISWFYRLCYYGGTEEIGIFSNCHDFLLIFDADFRDNAMRICLD